MKSVASFFVFFSENAVELESGDFQRQTPVVEGRTYMRVVGDELSLLFKR